ncbi:MAG: type II toxin-antitoxin system RelE/ParE family toxin [Bacteroidetes bacterium]|nr:type II toxin-antitoxin system RelE/ParE family toxin [Bacteroidota bacterium]
MLEYFRILYSDEVETFLDSLDDKARRKILYNIDKAKLTLDSKLLKKLTEEIWVFRTKFNTIQYRLFAFWDKSDNKHTLVIATHGIVKKSQKTLKAEIKKAMKIRHIYFENDF